MSIKKFHYVETLIMYLVWMSEGSSSYVLLKFSPNFFLRFTFMVSSILADIK